MVLKRVTPILGLLAVCAFASADITFENITATVTFNGTDTHDLRFDANSNGFEVDVSALDTLMYIDNATANPGPALVTIEYTAISDESISGLELIFSGWTYGGGSIDYREVVFDGDTEVASTFGTMSGDDPFTQTDSLSFSGGGLTTYRVLKTFNLSIDPQFQGASLATLNLVEQNAVPEPATMGALAIGALGLLRRRKRA